MTSPDSPSLSRGTPEKACDCEGLWNDPATSMGPVARESYNRTRHLPNCPSSKFNEWYARPALSEGEPTPANFEATHLRPPRSGMIAGMPKCQRCGVPLGSLQSARTSCVSPSLSTSSPEPTKMLDELQGKIRGDGAHVFGTPNRVDNRAAIAAARSAIELSFATLTEDSKRLEWMIEHGAFVADFNDAAEDGEPWECSWKEYGKSLAPRHRYAFAGTPRKAIDAARSLSGETPK